MSKVTGKLINISKSKSTHSHTYGQAIFSLEGDFFIEIDLQSYYINEMSYIYIPPNVKHVFFSNNDNRTLLINIPENIVITREKAIFDQVQLFSMDDKLRLLIRLMVIEIEDKPNSKSFEHLLLYLQDLIIEKEVFSSMEYLSNHFDENIKVSDLAAIEHYNTNYYREWFKEKTGLSPKEYIQKLRIEKAKELLITSSYSVTEIGFQVGYNQSSSFSRAFKDTVEISPKKYRTKYQ